MLKKLIMACVIILSSMQSNLLADISDHLYKFNFLSLSNCKTHKIHTSIAFVATLTTLSFFGIKTYNFISKDDRLAEPKAVPAGTEFVYEEEDCDEDEDFFSEDDVFGEDQDE